VELAGWLIFNAVVIGIIWWLFREAGKAERKTRSQGRSLDEMQKGRAG